MSDSSRRPLKSRGSWWAARCSKWLLQLGAKPNQVSLASMLFAGLSAVAMLKASSTGCLGSKSWLILLAVFCIQARLLCNLLDGMLAVEGRLKSAVGEIYNDLPDRISDIFIILGLGYSAHTSYYVSPEVLGWIAALSAVLTAYVRVLGVSAGTSHYFTGPMAKPHRMALLSAACLCWILENYVWGTDRVLFLTLLILIIGCAITMVRRMRMISSQLNNQKITLAHEKFCSGNN